MDGMVLNMSQTWHQLRPGEVRNDCGGCHAHSQKPTLFKDTAAARPDYDIFDLTKRTPLLVSSGLDEKSFQVLADFPVDGTPAGKNLVSQFKVVDPGVWELKLNRPITDLHRDKLTVSVQDLQGNVTRIERTFSVK